MHRPQIFNVILDTGSSDLWVAGTSCSVANGCTSNTVPFDSTKSTTFEGSSASTSTSTGLGANVQISYGSGGVEGPASQDTVSMSGLTISDQVFGACISR